MRLLEVNDGDCPRCQEGSHSACLDNPEEGMPCACAEGGHL